VSSTESLLHEYPAMPSLNFTPPHLAAPEPHLLMDWHPAAASARDVVAKKLRRVIIMKLLLALKKRFDYILFHPQNQRTRH
jgi:hypothetical protein